MTLGGPLIEIDIRHGFFASGQCPGLRLVPTQATCASIARAGGVVRATSRGIEIWLDEQRAGDWRDADPDDALTWLVRFDDDGMTNCTAGLGRPRQELAYFDASHATLDAPTGYWRLHGLHWAGAIDVRAVAAACADAALAPIELRGNPAALIRIPVRHATTRLRDGARYLIRFAPRETVWKYCFVGDWHEPALQVIDLAQHVRFQPAPPHGLADGRTAIAFRSDAPVALQQLPRERFQLLSRAGENNDEARARVDKVIVKRLPAAAPRHFSREVIDGVPALVSEIFVHR